MAANGSPPPVFETDEKPTSFVVRLLRHPLAQAPAEVIGEVTGEVERLLRALVREMSRQQIQAVLGLKGEEHFRKAYLTPALAAGMIETTQPDKPRSSKQRYRLTAMGRQWLRVRAHDGREGDG